MNQDMNTAAKEIENLSEVDLSSRAPSDPVVAFYARIDDESEEAVAALKAVFTEEIRGVADRFHQEPIGTWIQPMTNGFNHVVIAVTTDHLRQEELKKEGLMYCDHTTAVWPTNVGELIKVQNGEFEIELDTDNDTGGSCTPI